MVHVEFSHGEEPAGDEFAEYRAL